MDKTELARRKAEYELANARRGHFRRLILGHPTELAELVKTEISVNEIFKQLVLPGSEQVPEELFDPDEDRREASYKRNHPR